MTRASDRPTVDLGSSVKEVDMRRTLLPVAAALLGGLLIGSGALANAQDDDEEVIVAVTRPVGFKFIDHGRAGEGPGDVIVFKDALWNEAETERIGTRWGHCTLSFGPTAFCLGAAEFFGRGMLRGGGAVPLDADTYVVPITGGSGDFRNVSGEDRIAVLGEGRERLELHLSGTRR
jgi:hypothetical protein